MLVLLLGRGQAAVQKTAGESSSTESSVFCVGGPFRPQCRRKGFRDAVSGGIASVIGAPEVGGGYLRGCWCRWSSRTVRGVGESEPVGRETAYPTPRGWEGTRPAEGKLRRSPCEPATPVRLKRHPRAKATDRRFDKCICRMLACGGTAALIWRPMDGRRPAQGSVAGTAVSS